MILSLEVRKNIKRRRIRERRRRSIRTNSNVVDKRLTHMHKRKKKYIESVT